MYQFKNQYYILVRFKKELLAFPKFQVFFSEKSTKGSHENKTAEIKHALFIASIGKSIKAINKFEISGNLQCDKFTSLPHC